jgi:putative membrane protein
LTYARIQDIHVTRNIFERWLGIGTVQIQTASAAPVRRNRFPASDYSMRSATSSMPDARAQVERRGPTAAGRTSTDEILAGIRDELTRDPRAREGQASCMTL